MSVGTSRLPHLLASTTIMVTLITGCSVQHGYWPSSPPIGVAISCQGLKYAVEGHYNTTELIARMAGYSPNDAFRLALFSQAPDDEAVYYSAPWVGFWGLPLAPFSSYRSNVLNVLHSLHHGDHTEVLERRSNLKREIIFLVKSRKKEDDWKIGFLIHALGDSYAHSYGSLANLHGYNEFIGHILDDGSTGNRPDEIVANNNYLIYIEFVRALFEALTADSEDHARGPLDAFIARVRYRVEVERVTEDEFRNFVINYPACEMNAHKGIHEVWLPQLAQPQPMANDKIFTVDSGGSRQQMIKDIKKEINFFEVWRFLEDVRDRL